MNSKLISLITTSVVVLLFILGIFLSVKAMLSEGRMDTETQQLVGNSVWVARVIQFSLILLWLGAGAIVLFTILGIIFNPKRFVRSAIGLLVFGVLLLTGYLLAGDGNAAAFENIPADEVKWSGIGIYSTYVLLAVAIGLIVVQTIRNVVMYSSK